LQQYAGRLHREHACKANVRIIDFVDTGHPALLRMWEKRQRGYRAMGYRMGVDASDGQSSTGDPDAPGFVPFEQLHAGQAAAVPVVKVKVKVKRDWLDEIASTFKQR
jgi:superfamily II DNA or RNA helicase